MLEKIKAILKDLCPEVNFEEETALIDDGVLDSFDIISLAQELNETFDVSINVEDLEPENFNTPEAMAELINTLQKEEQ